MAATTSKSPALRTISRLAAWFTLVVALAVFVGGWVLDVEVLRSLVPGTVGMKALAAVGMGSLATSLLLLETPGSWAGAALGRPLAAFAVVLGAAVLIEYASGSSLGIDELLFRDRVGRAAHYAYPGRFAPTTALCFLAIGLALLTLDVRALRGWRLSELLVVPAGGIGAMTVIGYLYEIPSFYGPASAAKMALNTGCCVLALTLGVLLARPRGRLVRLATTDDPGGIMVRRLLPVAVALPLVLGWARLRAVHAGFVGERMGTWWLSLTTIGVLVLLIWRVALRLSHYAQERHRLQTELHTLANRDALTGVFNRRRFDEELTAAAARTARHGGACSLVIIDFDRMKRVNDALGHAAGDALLRAVSAVVAGRVRASDVVGRLGGDEFGVLLPGTGADDALVFAEALREAVSACHVATAAGDAWTTISLGVAELHPEHPDVERTLAAADAAMYASKRTGGDRVTRSGVSDPVTA